MTRAEALAYTLLAGENPVLWERYNSCPHEVAQINAVLQAERAAALQEVKAAIEAQIQLLQGFATEMPNRIAINTLKDLAQAIRQLKERSA